MTTTSTSPVEGARSGGGGRAGNEQRSASDGNESGGSRETWISTNKILNSSLCGRRTNSRNPNFDYDETKLLISLWGDPQVQKTLITTHKKHPVIAELARKMREQGYSRSTEEINTRIKNLKCFYNRIKKDMAAGIINQTTWRHYAEMDEIISRPVFGNAHRMHMMQQQKNQGPQQQQQQQQQQQKQQQSYLSGVTGGIKDCKPQAMSDNEGEEEEEDDLPLDQFPVKLEVMSEDDDEATEIRAEDLLMIDAKFPEENVTGGSVGGGSLGKSAAGTVARGKNINGRATNGRVGKQTDDDEEDDDDDEDDEEEDDDEGSDFDVENEFNDGLDELLLKARTNKNTTPNSSTTTTIIGGPAKSGFGMAAATTATSKPSSSCGLVIETISSANGTTISASGSSSSTASAPAPTAGKISVVPTNLLLKQPAVSTSITTPIQIYTQPTVSLASGAMMGTGKVTTGPGKIVPAGTVAPTHGTPGVTPMKLLLVNTVGKDGTTQQILTPASEVPTMPQLISAPNYHQTKIPLTLPPKTPIVSIPAVNVPAKSAELITGDPLPATGGRKIGQSAGFKTLLTQLVSIQRENLALNQERLALEKERLDFEKQFGGSFVTMVRNMSSFFSSLMNHQRQEAQANSANQKLKTATVTPTAAPVVVDPPPALMRKPEDDKPVAEEKDPLAPTTTTDGACATEESNGNSSPSPSSSSSSPSPAATDPLLVTPAVGSKRRTSAGDRVMDKTPSSETTAKESEPTGTATSQKQTATSAPSDAALPKKRRMMTRNSTQQSQAVPQPQLSSTDDKDALKTEVISDNDER